MLKHFAWLMRRRRRAASGRRAAAAETCRTWWSDPLSHPDLREMSLDQLADLPFDPRRICDPADPSRAGGR